MFSSPYLIEVSPKGQEQNILNILPLKTNDKSYFNGVI